MCSFSQIPRKAGWPQTGAQCLPHALTPHCDHHTPEPQRRRLWVCSISAAPLPPKVSMQVPVLYILVECSPHFLHHRERQVPCPGSGRNKLPGPPCEDQKWMAVSANVQQDLCHPPGDHAGHWRGGKRWVRGSVLPGASLPPT